MLATYLSDSLAEQCRILPDFASAYRGLVRMFAQIDHVVRRGTCVQMSFGRLERRAAVMGQWPVLFLHFECAGPVHIRPRGRTTASNGKADIGSVLKTHFINVCLRPYADGLQAVCAGLYWF